MVPCGRCYACKLNKARAWSVRIINEVKHSPSSCFITLTYNPENLPKNGSVVVEDCQKFLKRLRKNTGKKIRYFLGSEYGEEGKRPHYHLICFGIGKEERPTIDKSWGLGFVDVSDVTLDRALYVAKYTLKKLSGPDSGEYARRGIKPEFALMSRGGRGVGQGGIGSAYVEENKEWIRRNGFVIQKGVKVALPRFYADKVFNTDELKKELHEKRQKVINEGFELAREALARSGQSGLLGFNVADYQQMGRRAKEVELQAQENLKKRKL